ncbi:MAG: type II toxin-antitoxin system antitoxin SocA domain-containing protein [Tissierellaceae bacterium]|jgi:uncharacterized protein YwgA
MGYIDRYAIIIDKICDRTILGKKMLQKLMYLMERKGVDLNLNYSIHFYGPYSSKLDNAIQVLSSRDIINIDTSGMMHQIHIRDLSEVDNDLEEIEIQRVDFILDHFSSKTANELEALTTLDFVAKEVLKSSGRDEDIIEEVKKIKGSKYTTEYLQKELRILKDFGFLN